MNMERQSPGEALPDSLANEMESAEGEMASEERHASARKGDAALYGEPLLSPRSQVLRGRDEGFQERRMTYPVGSIYHLVPARLVFGAHCYFCQYCSCCCSNFLKAPVCPT